MPTETGSGKLPDIDTRYDKTTHLNLPMILGEIDVLLIFAIQRELDKMLEQLDRLKL